jgi:hypothetical protein
MHATLSFSPADFDTFGCELVPVHTPLVPALSLAHPGIEINPVRAAPATVPACRIRRREILDIDWVPYE